MTDDEERTLRARAAIRGEALLKLKPLFEALRVAVTALEDAADNGLALIDQALADEMAEEVTDNG